MAETVSKAFISRAIGALESAGHSIKGAWLRPGGDVMILTDEAQLPSLPAGPLDEELAEFRTRHGYG